MNTEFRLYSEVDYSNIYYLPPFSVVIDQSGLAWQYRPYVQSEDGDWIYEWMDTRDPLDRVQEFDGPLVLVYAPDQDD